MKRQITVNKRISAFCGKNGSGKTNLLDAIHYACFARSYFTKSDKIIPIQPNMGFRIDAAFDLNNEIYKTVCIYREDGKKELFISGEAIPKTSIYLGKFSCVMIAPDDISLINEGSENRRKWLDSMLCQIDKTYLNHLQQYQKIIVQRNALLKLMLEKNEKSNTILDYYNEQLQIHGNFIYECRVKHWKTIRHLIVEQYKKIAQKEDDITIEYESQLQNGNLLSLLQMNFHKDLMSQRTNYGIHKDDLVFTLKNELLKTIASQGQKKSFLLAMKLAELCFLSEELGNEPILLLDDIFERLDSERIHNLFDYLSKETSCQIFITDTELSRVSQTLNNFTTDFEVIAL